MAKQVYNDEKIKAIADEIRRIVPTLGWTKFTTSDIPSGIRRVYSEGKDHGYKDGQREGYNTGLNVGRSQGKNEGYQEGYNKGHSIGYNKGFEEGTNSNTGVELPELSNPGTANDLVEGKQLIDGKGNIVDGNIPIRGDEYVGLIGLDVTVPAGYYPEVVEKRIDADRIYMEGHTEGYSTGYSEGLTAGAENVKRDEAKTAEDVLIYLGERDEVVADIPVGYYNTKVEKRLDISTYLELTYDSGWNSGYNRGYEIGYKEGLAANTYEDGNEVAY